MYEFYIKFNEIFYPSKNVKVFSRENAWTAVYEINAWNCVPDP